MSDQTYFVKMHNRAMGPFPLARLQQMSQSGKLNHAHEVSVDGSNWTKAGEHPEIFASPAPAPVESPAPAAAPVMPAAAPVAQAPVAAHAPVAPAGQPAATSQAARPPGQIDWYYATNDDEPVGPVTKGEIIEYIKTGDIVRSDRVWQSQMEDWERAGKRVEFKAAFEQMHSSVPSVSGKSSNILDLVRLIVAAKQWLIILCVLLFAAAVSLLALFFTSFGDGVSQGESIKVQQAIFSLVLAGVFAGLIVLVYQFMVKSDEFVKSKLVDDFHDAFVWLNRFWITFAAALLLSVVFLVLVITGVLQ